MITSITSIKMALTLALLFLSSLSFAASESGPDLNNMSLEELLNVKIGVSSKKERTIQQTPSIVTLITAEDIRNSGATELIDVLQQVPGLQFGTDTQAAIGIGVRGNWAHEGKTLLLIDGEEMNEILYSTLQLGNHYPIDAISRIEIIRGPGSAIYGGYAELAVINIITKSAAELNGFQVSGSYGQMTSTHGHRNLNLNFGKKVGNWNITSSGFVGQSNASDRMYVDGAGSSYSFKGNSNVDPVFVNLGLSNENLKVRLIYDRYHTTDKTAYGVNVSKAVDTNFDSFYFGTSYNFKPTEQLTITPELHLKQQEPWNSTNPEAREVLGLYYNKTGQEVKVGLNGNYEFSPSFSVHTGASITMNRGIDHTTDSLFQNGKDTFTYYKNAMFAELNWDPDFVKITAGGRFENNNTVGSATVPRIAATKQFGDFHSKLLHSWGFRTPGIENIRLKPDIQPETTKSTEIEMGYRITSDMIATINFFHILIKKPIIYDYAAGEAYKNVNETGSRGLEFDYKWTSRAFRINASYSYYHANTTIADSYAVPQSASNMLGFANHKITTNINVNLLRDKSRLNFSSIFYAPRWGYDWNANDGAVAIRKFDSHWLLNAFIQERDLGIKGFDLGLGVDNILNQDYRYIQPYNGSHAPVPSQSREWIAKAEYRIELR